ncbi:hypothetical protein DVH05_027937 [Phytophthora capsici]|nr:hypothetical protein DVH05_027937 [Phytophthora capsici]
MLRQEITTTNQDFSKFSLKKTGDADYLDTITPQVQRAEGNWSSSQQITHELRNANYNLDKVIVALLE